MIPNTTFLADLFDVHFLVQQVSLFQKFALTMLNACAVVQ